MPELTLGLAVSSFIAGLLMFLAPCTLPLVPAYLAFISGMKQSEVDTPNEKKLLFTNALFFVLGFTLVFTVFGILAGFFGTFIGSFRGLLTQIGGLFIIFFGLMMLRLIKIKPLMSDRKIKLPSFIEVGHPSSSFVVGSTFALGWTPCVGPVLATVLLLATTSTTVLSGGFLLLIFSLGLAIPFLLVALLYTKASSFINRHTFVTVMFNYVGGIFLILIGVLLMNENLGLLVEYGYSFFNFIGLSNLFNYF